MLPSGHFDEITDLQWDPDGKYLMTTSADKTTRLYAPYKKKPTVSTCHIAFGRKYVGT